MDDRIEPFTHCCLSCSWVSALGSGRFDWGLARRSQFEAGLLSAERLEHFGARADMSKIFRRVVARDLGVGAGSSHKSNLN